MKILRRKSKQELDELEEMEDYLESALQPVEPRPGFIADLRARLETAPVPQRQWPKVLRYSLVAAAGVVSSAIIVITGIRAALTILGALGALKHVRSQMQQKGAAAVPPAI
jgi:hypothetical protein